MNTALLPLPTEPADMLLIHCPYCGPRAELEFHCGGEGGVVRPPDAENMDDAQWGDYVFMRRNTRGVHHEQWCHDAGCGKWFNALRDTVTYQFIETFPVGHEPLRTVASPDTRSVETPNDGGNGERSGA